MNTGVFLTAVVAPRSRQEHAGSRELFTRIPVKLLHHSVLPQPFPSLRTPFPAGQRPAGLQHRGPSLASRGAFELRTGSGLYQEAL